MTELHIRCNVFNNKKYIVYKINGSRYKLIDNDFIYDDEPYNYKYNNPNIININTIESLHCSNGFVPNIFFPNLKKIYLYNADNNDYNNISSHDIELYLHKCVINKQLVSFFNKINIKKLILCQCTITNDIMELYRYIPQILYSETNFTQTQLTHLSTITKWKEFLHIFYAANINQPAAVIHLISDIYDTTSEQTIVSDIDTEAFYLLC